MLTPPPENSGRTRPDNKSSASLLLVGNGRLLSRLRSFILIPGGTGLRGGGCGRPLGACLARAHLCYDPAPPRARRRRGLCCAHVLTCHPRKPTEHALKSGRRAQRNGCTCEEGAPLAEAHKRARAQAQAHTRTVGGRTELTMRAAHHHRRSRGRSKRMCARWPIRHGHAAGSKPFQYSRLVRHVASCAPSDRLRCTQSAARTGPVPAPYVAQTRDGLRAPPLLVAKHAYAQRGRRARARVCVC